MQRRQFLATLSCLPFSPKILASKHERQMLDRYILIPGYQVKKAINDGVVKNHFNYPEATLVSRLDLRSDKIVRRVFPIRGHEICVHPHGLKAFYACQSRKQMLSFDIETLEIEQIQQTDGKNFVGGGHAVYSTDGRILITTERRISSVYQGLKKQHFGQLVVRDAVTLKVLDVYSSQGVLPHEIQFINGGKQLVVAHYGSIEGSTKGSIRTIEPSISIIEMNSGKLLDKFIPQNNDYEIRHLAIRDVNKLKGFKKLTYNTNDGQNKNDLDSIIAITNRLQRKAQGNTHLPAPAFTWSPFSHKTSSPKHKKKKLKNGSNIMLHRSQSVVIDPVYDEAIVSVTEANQIAILNATTGQAKQIISTKKFNILRPRGITLLNNPDLYAVAGSFHGVVLINRGEHKPLKYFDTPLYQHSHITKT